MTPVRALLRLGLLLPLAACGHGMYEGANPSPENVSYACEDGRTVVVRYFDHSATVRLPDGPAVDTTRQQGGQATASPAAGSPGRSTRARASWTRTAGRCAASDRADARVGGPPGP